ncbi:ATP12 family protein [Polymorphobacter sp.]|uniref:ATP12 family protein n=1 Tax=Polymorphobacter sp. TaxID=1909290 RepID=UPI003F70FAB6
MKRFWTHVTVEPLDQGFGLALDSRPLKTPARARLALPNAALADAVAAEWQAVADKLDPARMPFTGLANAAQDLIAADAHAHAARLAAYAAHDLLCYRAENPPPLVRRQAEAWDPVLDWATQTQGWRFTVTAGLMPVAQPADTLAAVESALAARPPAALAAHAQLIPLSGSALLALALDAGQLDPDTAWATADLDDAFQAEHWGEDEEGLAMRRHRQQAFLAAARFLALSKA